MFGYKIIRTGLVIYAIFACLGISGIQLGLWISILGLVILLINKKRIVLYTNNENKQVMMLVGIFLLWLLISSIFGVDTKHSLKKLVELVGQVCMILVVMNVIEDEDFKFKKKLINILLIVCVLQSIYAVVQYFTGVDFVHKTNIGKYARVQGTFGYFNTLGGLLGLVLPILFSYTIFIPSKEVLKKIIFYFSFILVSLALVFTSTRGAWIGVFVGIIFISIIKFGWKTIFVLLVIPLLLLFPPIKNRIKNTLSNPDSGRIFIWKKTFSMIKSKPIFGYGFDNFKEVFYKNLDSEGEKSISVEKRHFHSHNIILNTAVESGILGSVLLLIVLGLIFKYAISKISRAPLRVLYLGITGSIIDFYVHGTVDNVLRGETGYLFWFLVGILYSLSDKRND